MTLDNTLNHYNAVASEYNKAWFYEDGTDYRKWLLDAVSVRLQASPTSRVVDLGAGTGNFSIALHHKCNLQQKILCVDPSEALLLQAKQAPEVDTLLADGMQFSRLDPQKQSYDRLLFKEVIHHFDKSEHSELFQGAFRQLHPEGRLLIVTRPHDSSHYPFFQGAYQAWSQAQLDEAIYVRALQAVGFQVQLEYADYTISMPASRWLGMVKGRFWSNFNGFSEEEMEVGLKEIRGKLGVEGEEDPVISFPDRIVFIIGIKA